MSSIAVDIPAGSPAVVTDDLVNVLTHAVYSGDAAADTGTVSVTGTTLTWTGGLTAGQTATITYTVKVASNAPIGARVTNLVTSDPTLATLSLAGGAVSPTASTTTVVSVLALTGSTLIGLLAGAITLLIGVLFMLFAAWRRRRREDDEPVVAQP